MKCDELQERWFESYPVEGDQIIATKVYSKKDADDAIAELKEVYKDSVDVKVKIWERCKKVEDELRKTQRALWMARAERANAEWGHWATIWFCNTNVELNINKSSVSQDPYRCTTKRNAAIWRNIWYDVENKCRAKAKEFE